MSIRNFAVKLVLILSTSAGLFSCKHEIPVDLSGGNNNPTTSSTCSSDTVYFTNSVQPLLQSNCAYAGCHDAVSRKDGVDLSSYAKIIATGKIRPGDPNNSELYKVLFKTGDDRMPPPPNAALSTEQKNILYKWILQGAKNNSCNDCDTTVFTYSGAVSPLINTWCKGCHNPASAGGGIDLSTYPVVRVQALNGKLMGSITHAPGFSPMPQGGNKWSDCQIRQVQKWIQAGAQNN
jgi:hypothetical protein